MSDLPFSLDLSALKSRAKEASNAQIETAVARGEELGFTSREAASKRGRKPSPRTGQIHAKVLPEAAQLLAQEARLRGVQQGVILEEALALYLEAQKAR